MSAKGLGEGYIDGPDAWRGQILEEIEKRLDDHDVRNITVKIQEERVSEEERYWGGVIREGGYGEDNPKKTTITIELEKTGEYSDVDDQEQFEEKFGDSLENN